MKLPSATGGLAPSAGVVVRFSWLHGRSEAGAVPFALVLLLFFLGSTYASPPPSENPALEEVASFPHQQVTGVTVSKEGRIFVNFPFWSDDHTTSVAEVLPGNQLKPYPDEAWNAKDGPLEKRWICVQSVVVDDENHLWVLDPASPKIEAVVKGGPKLVECDLKTNRPLRTIRFDDSVAPERSYLNDVRFDTQSGHAFITESGVGSIIVVDLHTGKAQRRLVEDASTKKEPSAEIEIDGKKIIDPKTGTTPNFNADGIALDREAGWLYYHALGGETLYRVRTKDLIDESLSEKALASKVENLGKTPKPDGMLEGPNGVVFLTALEDDGIARFDVATRKTTMILRDPRLQWPDTMAWGPEGYLYVTASQINHMPKYNGGENKQQGPYCLFRMKAP